MFMKYTHIVALRKADRETQVGNCIVTNNV